MVTTKTDIDEREIENRLLVCFINYGFDWQSTEDWRNHFKRPHRNTGWPAGPSTVLIRWFAVTAFLIKLHQKWIEKWNKKAIIISWREEKLKSFFASQESKTLLPGCLACRAANVYRCWSSNFLLKRDPHRFMLCVFMVRRKRSFFFVAVWFGKLLFVCEV